MMNLPKHFKRQQSVKFFTRQKGYFLIIAVILILIIGMLGTLITYLFANRAQLSAAQLNGLKAFYIAESGLEIGTHYLLRPNLSNGRIGCSEVTEHSQLTNANFDDGTFTLTTTNNSPIYAIDTLSTSITSSATTINAISTAGFAPSGRILIDREAIDYAAIAGNSFTGITRGVNDTLASTHVIGAKIGQYQCSMDVQAGIPTVLSPRFKRELQWNIQLQEAWVGGNVSGNNFMLTHWNRPAEVSWTAESIAGGNNAGNINGISMLSYADGWAVANEAQNNLIFLRWNGNTWQVITMEGCNNQHLTSVSMVSSRDGYAVGARYKPNCGSGNNRFTIIRWNGLSWALLTPPTIPTDNNNNQNLNAVHVIDTAGNGLGTIGFAVGNSGQILRYNGSTWVQMTSPTTLNLNGVYTISNQEAWAVGNSGVILRWNGNVWSSIPSPVGTQLNDIAMYDTNGDGLADIGWAVGNSARILSYNGSTWSAVDIGSANLFGVSIFNTQDAWVVGSGGSAYHWDGNTWTGISTGTTVQLNHISVVPNKQQPNSNWQQIFH